MKHFPHSLHLPICFFIAFHYFSRTMMALFKRRGGSAPAHLIFDYYSWNVAARSQ